MAKVPLRDTLLHVCLSRSTISAIANLTATSYSTKLQCSEADLPHIPAYSFMHVTSH
jgi:hypothetical protein